MAHLHIVCETDDLSLVKDFSLRAARVSIGREAGNSIVLVQAFVSSRHAVIEREGGDYFLTDLDSANGTLVNGRKVNRTILNDGDAITIGQIQMRFVADDDYATRPGWDKATRFDMEEALDLDVELPAPVVKNGAIRILSGPSAGREMTLTKDITTMGKAGVLAVNIVRRDGSFHLTATVGAEAVKINGIPLYADEIPLHDQDTIDLGSVRLLFYLH